MPVETAFLYNFLIALGLGTLIGLEREHRRDETQVIAGVRTFPLVSLSGFMVGLLAQAADSDLVVALGVVSATAFAATFHVVRHRLGVTGLTTPAAMLVTFLLGLLVAFGFILESLVIGVTTTFLLLTKRRLHRFAFHLDDEEMMSALQFITVLFILFPLAQSLTAPVPYTQGLVGPGTLIDPYRVLLIVIFVSAISFVSFLAMREAGPTRGIYATGLLGGLVSSEATAVSLAKHAEEVSGLTPLAVVGTMLATASMVLRNLAIAVFVDPTLRLMEYILPAVVLVSLGALALAWHRRKAVIPGQHLKVDVKSPFAVGPALKFAAWFTVVTAVTGFMSNRPDLFGTWGVYVAALGAFGSAGAVIASVGTLLVTGTIPLEVAGQVAVLAIIVGAGNKLVILRVVNPDVFDHSWRGFTIVTLLGVVGLVVSLFLFGP